MAKSRTAIKTRIKSISATKKITNAMQLISNIKFQRYVAEYNRNKDYSKALEDTSFKVFNSANEIESIYSRDNGIKRNYSFVFLSDLGLCGAYNINLIKYLETHFNVDDYYVVVGTSQYNYFIKNGFNVVNKKAISNDDVSYLYLQKLMVDAIAKFENDEVGKINIIYTKYINNITFEPTHDELLPFVVDAKKDEYHEIILEPDANEVIDHLIPIMINNTIYNRYLQACACEHASRRFAMENATDNANELIDDLTLEFNQARQAAITQEITEIVSGADAL